MGTRYEHLTIEERCELARLHAEGHSVRQIAAGLDRSPSTVARELRRNGSKTQGYRPSYAQQQAAARRWRGRRGGSPASFIAHRRPLSQRTKEADDRSSAGHWEAVLMLFGNHGQALLVLQERHSRLLATARVPGKAAEPVARALADLLAPFPARWRRTVAFDNGTEFARHYQLHQLGIENFFCDVRSPWQKGGVENRIGRLRRYLPRRTDLSALQDLRLAQFVKVAVALAYHGWTSWPSRETLCRLTNLKSPHVTRATNELEKAGFVTRRRRYHTGGNVGIQYTFNGLAMAEATIHQEHPTLQEDGAPHQ